MNAPERLVQARLASHVVDAMDAAIALSRGAYSDRSQFISDAIQDKLAVDGAASPSSAGGTPVVTDEAGDPPALLDWGAWQDQGLSARTAEPSMLVCFGLHNRDLPSLVAADRLASIVADTGEAVLWADFTRQLRAEAGSLANRLARLDQQSPRAIKLATGFPRPGQSNRNSEDRFIAASVGTSPRRADAPMRVLGLMFADDDLLLPSSQAVELLGDLIDLGLPSTLMPPSAAATRRWLKHLADNALGEAAAWRRLLLAVARRPTRSALVGSFPEWEGATAETNCMGLVSRAREWGLLQPELSDRRYELTSLGKQVLEEVT